MGSVQTPNAQEQLNKNILLWRYMDRNCIRIIATVMMFILIACGATAYLAYYEVQELNDEKDVRLLRLKEIQWQYIWCYVNTSYMLFNGNLIG